MPTFSVTTLVPSNPGTVFRAALSPDLHAGSMSRYRERATSTVETLGLDDVVTFSAQHFGLNWRLTSRIVELAQDQTFTDEQVSGPFKRFRHTHRFLKTDGGCRMIDEITYEAPFGWVGDIAERLVLDRYLRRLIADRGQFLAQASAG